MSIEKVKALRKEAAAFLAAGDRILSSTGNTQEVIMWKACPECGDIQDLRGLEVTHAVCYKCTPHIFLMDAQELLMHAEITFHRGRGLRRIALNLTRQNAIWECIENAVAEYSDAQREGLDCNAAWDCAKEGMNELLK